MNVIYEVNLEVEPAIRTTFGEWLQEHVEEMLELPGFLGASVECVERAGNEPAAFCVRYRVKSRQALEEYFRKHAAAMREEGIRRFGKRFTATRRILRPA